ncbi:MAG: hydroxymethylbilane synthase, partial [Candidatus Obscuribacterales bacterium]|nr:hydroxymethylbilane synthase [Candidatus Obscuribacterales bacterium]
MRVDSVLVGTRASKLARLQTDFVIGKLKALYPAKTLAVKTISTGGDKNRSIPIADLGVRGAFVKELEDALLSCAVDLVVHSLKDMTTELPGGLCLIAVLDRADRHDVLVSHEKSKLTDLLSGSRIATSSRRRTAQLKALRNDLEFVDIRGNVPTRIKKMENGQCEAMVLAAAGLIRLGLDQYISETFSEEILTPAAGQGALAIECRENDEELIKMLIALDDPNVRAQVDCERAFLAELGGGCSVPIGASARLKAGKLILTGCIASLDGSAVFRDIIEGEPTEAVETGKALARKMLS